MNEMRAQAGALRAEMQIRTPLSRAALLEIYERALLLVGSSPAEIAKSMAEVRALFD